VDAVDQAHLSIGEVLSLLQEEFPDVTISKIRFLESQGLIEPERTPSGYRRFHDPDIERLRWVLRQQRDHFLPLKVIKAKLDQDGPAAQPTLFEPTGDPQVDAGGGGTSNGAVSTALGGTPADSPLHDEGPTLSGGPAAPPSGATEPADRSLAERPDPGAWLAALQATPESDPLATDRAGSASSTPSAVTATSGERISREDLIRRSGVDDEHVGALVDFGLLRPTVVAGEELFAEEAVEIASVTMRFVGLGVGVRNLRTYRLAADREIGVIEALLLPLLKQRNPEARTRAVATAEQLADLGAVLRAALVRQSLAPHLR